MSNIQNSELIQVKPFLIIGITIRTTNQGGKSSQDIGMLWQRFHKDQLIHKIPNKRSNTVYSIYTEYESDYQGEYTSIIGCQVSSLEEVPADMVAKTFTGGPYRKITARGTLPDAIADCWQTIWKEDKQLDRAYTTDFEAYDERAANFEQGEVDIYLAV